MTRHLYPAFLALLCACAPPEDGAADTDGPCPDGEASCPCFADDSCLAGLTCELGSCVEDPAPVCGNGALEDGEACDMGALNADEGICTSLCTVQVCGDGFQGPGEGCDDGNAEDGDGCLSTCVLATCGDGVVSNGEACDDGNDDNSDACTNMCTAAVCGDGVVSEGEACDDGNADDTDFCTSACAIVPRCGNGVAEEELCLDQELVLALPHGGSPRGMVGMDLDQDGHQDLVVAMGGGNTLAVAYGDGAGGLTPFTATVPVCGHPIDLAAADLDADGVQELAIACFSGNQVLVAPTTGDRLNPLGTVVDVNTMDALEPRRVVMGDLDGDGVPDVGFAARHAFAPWDGDVYFATAVGEEPAATVDYEVVAPVGGPIAMGMAQLNGAGSLEFVAAVRGTGVCAGQLGQLSTCFGGPAVWNLKVGDVTGDGHDDVVAVAWDEVACDYTQDPDVCPGDEVLVYAGTGDDDLLSAPGSLPVGKGAIDLALADLDGNGALDVVALSSVSRRLDLHLGLGDGQFEAQTVPGVGAQPFAVVAHDLNGDGRPDLAVTDLYTRTVKVYLTNL